MNSQQYQIITYFRQSKRCFFFSFMWLLGLVAGIAVIAFSGDIYLIANTAVKLKPNFWILFLINTFPFLALLGLFRTRSYGTVGLLLFVYGLFYGFCGMCVIFTFGSGGWLVRGLLLFSSSLVSLLIWWLILSFDSIGCVSLKQFCNVFLIVCLITLIDYFVISPFLIGIF